ncbi:MAG TPA: DUF1553 domain-containing protein [Pirellulales bacterium]|jgi:hypothetical protein|nr:DUF1553 domain-containing protein [Pirellulales bacterium]
MRSLRVITYSWLAVVGWLVGTGAAADNDPMAFFEAKIRPVLAEKCYSCHSADSKTLRGGLLVDTRDGLLHGGDSGPAVIPKNPDESLLLQALKYDGFEMPPTGKLSEETIANFERWIALGAPDPRIGKAAEKRTIDIAAGKNFWSFRPIAHPEPPTVQNAAWSAGAIDRFVLAGLEAKGLSPAPDADRTTWLRRVTFDLIGLPPTLAEIDDFLADRSPHASERVVDRLLASAHFGERWGRHWLDVARFAESSGGGRSLVFDNAWRYRDYVIDSFNRDKPFDQFIVEQLAGDLLPHKTPAELETNLVATGYLILGAINYEEQDKQMLEMDVADEQLDAIGKGLLGMTIGCARCHDHKFDPIPTSDYYALAGIMRSTKVITHENVSHWVERPLPMEPERAAAVEQYDAQVAAIEGKLKAAKALFEKLTPKGSMPAGPLAVDSLQGIVVDDIQAKRVGAWRESTSNTSYIGSGYLTDDGEGKGTKTATFQPEFKKAGMYDVRVAYAPHANRDAAVPVSILHADGEFSGTIDERDTPPIDDRFVSLGRFRFDETNQWFVLISNEGTTGHVTIDAVQFLPVDAMEPAKEQKPELAKVDDASAKTAIKAKREMQSLQKEMKALQAKAPPRPKAMAVEEAEKIEDCPLCIRGNVHHPGPAVPRGVLQVATTGEAPTMPSDHSGRLELARWIASPENPLTARVYANRVWHHLFGVGLVRTVDNFGTTGELPSHPELVDCLAARLIDSGWSTKRLVREVVLSRAYRMSVADNATARAVDPDNRLLWRMNRKRLDAEELRDAILMVSGQMEWGCGGPVSNTRGNSEKPESSTEYGHVFTDVRRSIYTPAFRNRVMELFEAFDFADPNSVAGRRNTSTVAPQALFLLNSPFVMDQAQLAAERALAEAELTDGQRVECAFRETLGRKPSAREKKVALAAVKLDSDASAEARADRWERLFQALFGCIDFRYLE